MTPRLPHPLRRSALRGRLGSTLLAAAALAWLAVAPAAHAQPVQGGALLIAGPAIDDPNFAKAVVLVLRHDDSGTIGVVINRATTLVPGTVFPELAPELGLYKGTLFRGGPVAPTRVLFLVRGLAAATVQGPEIVDKVFLSGDPAGLADVARLAQGTDDLRVYAGHAEWMAGQLESEIGAGAWHVVQATSDLVFQADMRSLWERLSRRGDEVTADARSP